MGGPQRQNRPTVVGVLERLLEEWHDGEEVKKLLASIETKVRSHIQLRSIRQLGSLVQLSTQDSYNSSTHILGAHRLPLQWHEHKCCTDIRLASNTTLGRYIPAVPEDAVNQISSLAAAIVNGFCQHLASQLVMQIALLLPYFSVSASCHLPGKFYIYGLLCQVLDILSLAKAGYSPTFLTPLYVVTAILF